MTHDDVDAFARGMGVMLGVIGGIAVADLIIILF